MNLLARVAAAVAGVGVAGVGYGTFVEAAAYRVRRHTLPVLDPGAEALRVLHLSDTHLLRWYGRRRAFLASLAGLRPDLVVATGDFLSDPDAAPAFVQSLGALLDVPGAFVFGSNDFHGPTLRNPVSYVWTTTATDEADLENMRPAELAGLLTRRGWVDLNEHRTVLEIRGQRLELRGTGDAHESRDDYSAVAGPAEPGTVPLGLTHAPYRRILDAMARDGVRLLCCGHTHGGQVRVPLYGALTSNSDLPPELARGVHRHTTGDGASCFVHVSAGLGMSPFTPFRFACPPEVSLLTLTARPV